MVTFLNIPNKIWHNETEPMAVPELPWGSYTELANKNQSQATSHGKVSNSPGVSDPVMIN